MHVLVTGGAGFIGSHLVDSLLADGCQVTCLDNFDPFYERSVKEQNVLAHRPRRDWRLVEADLRDAAGLSASLTDAYDCIVHLAARGGVRRSIDDPVGYQAVNVAGTQNLLEFARRRGIRQFVFASSSSVYGLSPRVPWSEDDNVLKPISPYASTKVSGELMGHVYSQLYGIRFVALRLFTVYGPRQRPDLAIHKFARLLLEGRPIPVFGDGTTKRDYTFIDDVVRAVRGAIEYRGAQYEVINIGNNRAITLIEMIRGLESGLGRTAAIEWLPAQPGDLPQTWADVEKARRLLDYEPRTPFSEGIRRFGDWMLAQAASAT